MPHTCRLSSTTGIHPNAGSGWRMGQCFMYCELCAPCSPKIRQGSSAREQSSVIALLSATRCIPSLVRVSGYTLSKVLTTRRNANVATALHVPECSSNTSKINSQTTFMSMRCTSDSNESGAHQAQPLLWPWIIAPGWRPTPYLRSTALHREGPPQLD